MKKKRIGKRIGFIGDMLKSIVAPSKTWNFKGGAVPSVGKKTVFTPSYKIPKTPKTSGYGWGP